MDVVVEAVALVEWFNAPDWQMDPATTDATCPPSPGWYVLDAEVPEAGRTGPFATKAAASAHARACGYTEVR